MTSPIDPGQSPFGPAHQPPGAPPMHPQPGGVATIAPEDDPDDMPMPKGRGPASTKALAVGLAVVLAFGAGVMAQKRNDKGMIRPPTGPAAALAAAAAGAGGGAAAPPAAPAVPGENPLLARAKLKGELVSVNGNEFTIKDDKGIERKATLAEGTMVLKGVSMSEIPPGTRVYADGQDAADGSTTVQIVIVPK
ncbi:MAG: hypothetical protein ACT4QG_22010 [Sporichthyaceae bacterium]